MTTRTRVLVSGSKDFVDAFNSVAFDAVYFGANRAQLAKFSQSAVAVRRSRVFSSSG
jgi:hypothetical protein